MTGVQRLGRGVACALAAPELAASFVPATARAEALAVWAYEGGPWRLRQQWPLR